MFPFLNIYFKHLLSFTLKLQIDRNILQLANDRKDRNQKENELIKIENENGIRVEIPQMFRIGSGPLVLSLQCLVGNLSSSRNETDFNVIIY